MREGGDEAQTRELVRLLRAAVGEQAGAGGGRGGTVLDPVDASPRRRAEYSSDASNYRVVPQVVVFPRSVDEVMAVAEVCRSTGTPLTTRGGGTSVAGNSVGPGVVMDLSRYLTAPPVVDPDTRTAVVAPGVILDDLQAAARPYGLRFGPDPSTHARATLGGMIGNNACGPRAVAYGRTADNVVSLDVLDGTGRRFTAARLPASFPAAVGPGGTPGREGPGGGAVPVPGLAEFVRANLGVIRTELGRFTRQVSGYSLEHLLPERGAHLGRALVGTEGTCVIVLGATVRLVELPKATATAVLGFPDMPAAADAAPALLPHRPLAVEGLDARLVDMVRRHRGAARVPELPDGGGWLFVEVGGETQAEALAAARRLAAEAGTSAVRVLPAGPAATALWRIREDGAGLAGRTPAGDPAWPGWEDAAVPPENLGAYLRGFADLLRRHGLDGLIYGHFGDGCVHVRIDLPLADHPARLRPFLRDAAELVVAHGGSLSGEHGDGRARGELLDVMYSPAALAAFAAFKHLFDPRDLLNPGVLVRPRPLDADLRRPAAAALPARPDRGGFAFTADGGDLTAAVHRCVGLGKCRADTSAAGGFMCPSYQATRDEKDSTRGRARVLQELMHADPAGRLVRDGWRDPAVRESLELCLACRACSRDCPAGVDVATYKSEVLHRAYRRRLRPPAHYALGWLPRWARLAGHAPGLVNRALGWAPLRRVLFRAAGLDARRPAPAFAAEPFHRWWARQHPDRDRKPRLDLGLGQKPNQPSAPSAAADGRPEVLLWVDSFTDAFAPQIGRAALAVLTAAGYRVTVPDRPVCCGLTWITTGQLDGARRRLRQAVRRLAPAAAAGVPIVGLEPSCTAVLRADLPELLPGNPDAAAVAGAVHTLAELLSLPHRSSPGTHRRSEGSAVTIGGAPGQDSGRGRPAPAPAGAAGAHGTAEGPVVTTGGEGWVLPRLDGVRVLAQPHCHQHAVMGFQADRELLERAGAEVETLAGCCGLAGNFGMERGHYEVSVAVAEHALLPALRAAGDDAVLLADGFSCRTQAAQLAGRRGRHLAELLAEHLTP